MKSVNTWLKSLPLKPFMTAKYVFISKQASHFLEVPEDVPPPGDTRFSFFSVKSTCQSITRGQTEDGINCHCGRAQYKPFVVAMDL